MTDSTERSHTLPLAALLDTLVEHQPIFGVALHRLITDQQHVPIDYTFIHVNQAFERYTGLQRADILGKNVLDVLPNLSEDSTDWVRLYGDVVQSGEPTSLEQYSEALQRWYRITAYCPQSPFFVTLIQDITADKQVSSLIEDRAMYYQLVFQHMNEGLVTHSMVYDDQGTAIDYRLLDVNHAFERILGRKREDVAGKLASEVYGGPAFLDIYTHVAATMEPYSFDAPFGGKVYSVRAFSPRKGEFVTMFFDVTEERQHAEAQQTALRELSTPLIPIAKGVVVMPLIGTIDTSRTSQVQATLLEGVAHYQAHTVILDITGVQQVDSQTANGFVQAAQAVRLLGAQVLMTGIHPQIAQTLVQLGVDLFDIQTHSTLQAGIAAVLGTR